MASSDRVWVFGYGSLIWRPSFNFLNARVAWVDGWSRRFWQGSTDHRGIPGAPGRVVTLVEIPDQYCGCVAYEIESEVATQVFAELDRREIQGYGRWEVEMRLNNGETIGGIVYIAMENNPHYLGDDVLSHIAKQIACARGPSGSNWDYVKRLGEALRDFGIVDTHVFEVEKAVARLIREPLVKSH